MPRRGTVPATVGHHEVLGHGKVQLREPRTDQLVAPDVSERAAFRTTPGAQRLSVGGQRGHAAVRGQRRGDEPGVGGLVLRLPVTHQIRAAPAGVAVGVAVTVAGCEWQPALPGVDGRELPPADDRVQRLARVARYVRPAPNGSSQTPLRPNTCLRWLSFGP